MQVMNYKMIGRFIGHILLVEAIFMLPALFIGLYKNENMACIGFGASLCIILLLALLLLMLCRGSKRRFTAKEGFVCVRNPMNFHQVSRIELSPEVVDCIVFCRDSI